MAETSAPGPAPASSDAAVEFLEDLAPADLTVRRRAMAALLRSVTRLQAQS